MRDIYQVRQAYGWSWLYLRVAIHFPSVIIERLMLLASFILSPSAPVWQYRSEPARSTTDSLRNTRGHIDKWQKKRQLLIIVLYNSYLENLESTCNAVLFLAISRFFLNRALTWKFSFTFYKAAVSRKVRLGNR